MEAGSPDRTWNRTATALITIGWLVLFFALPHDLTGDGYTRFHALAELIDHHARPHIAYSIVGPLFSTPLYLMGRVSRSSAWWCARYNTFVLGFALCALYALLRRVTHRRLLLTFLLLIVAASMFPNHVREYYGEVFTAASLAIGLAAFALDRPLIGTAASVIGVANIPGALVGLGLVCLARIWETRRLRFALPVLIACGAVLLDYQLQRGSIFDNGYMKNHGVPTVLPYSGVQEFGYPLWFGLWSLFLSFGKGLLFFAPGLLFWPRQGVDERLKRFHRYGLWLLAGLVLVYARWWAWYGGWFWGPRFYLFASIPASLGLAVALMRVPELKTRQLVMLLAAVTLSFWVAIDGAVFNLDDLDVCNQPPDYALGFVCWYVPEFSVLWRPFITSGALSVFTRPVGVYVVFGVAAYMFVAWPLVRATARALWSDIRTLDLVGRAKTLRM